MFELLKKFMERLVKSNENEFRGQSPDCCTINRPEKQVKPEDKDKSHE